MQKKGKGRQFKLGDKSSLTTPPIVGKFQVQKARELNIPPGPLYSKLKNGESVTYKNPSSSEEVTVHPEQVLEGGSDGIAVALIYCPDEYVFRQFYDGRMDIDNDNDTSTDVSASPNIGKLNQYKEKHHQTNNQSNATTNLELMVHHTPKKMFESEMYQAWMREFGTNVKHITLHPLEEGVHRFHFAGGESNEEFDGSPFRSGVMGAMQRSLIHSDIFPNPLAMAKCPSFSSESESKGDVVGGDANSNAGNDDSMTIYHGRPQLEYTFVPLAKKGLDTSTLKSTEKGTFGVSKEEREAIHNETKNSGALEAAAKILVLEEEKDTKNDDTQKNEASHASPASTGCFIFTGTGSAIPCKHRNVTGMYLRMNNGNGMLLDCGEGTLGQLIRSWRSSYNRDIIKESESEYIRSCVKNIKAAWISHPHADHHLGLIRFLSERNSILLQSGSLQDGQDDRIVLMASPNIFRFLDEYSKVDPSVYGGYIPVDCRDTLPDVQEPLGEGSILHQKLGLTRCISVPVSHCYHSFAVVLDGTSFGRLVYSGDCRPSDRLVEVGQGADLLIREATFENGMEEEAVLKMHSTVSEALSVSKRMSAKACILTHFSQRYPRIPPLRKEDSQLSFPVAFAFDFMKVTPDNIVTASRLTSAMRMLYPEDVDEGDSAEAAETKRAAKEILSMPGLFASSMKCDMNN
eukprot:CAMPEP_0181106776 /NCGR_PEP_ID=MMETSP1071-20121207/16708_1 /TAXON_ID=35127 /ORGANISM="Thalassiosira sp., Strain NH16" /LENGTH=687 /DNA_ID=CAMNT_0023190197 /DNA_START=1404 /DNA_END=3468 /DNA_ORIENTATION=-